MSLWHILPNSTKQKFESLQWRHNGHNGVSIKSPASRLLTFTQQLIQVQIKKPVKLRVAGHLCGEFTGHWWLPRTNGQWRGKCFHLMTASWSQVYMSVRYTLGFRTSVSFNKIPVTVKSQNLNVFRLVLQLSLPNPVKSGVKSRMKI